MLEHALNGRINAFVRRIWYFQSELRAMRKSTIAITKRQAG